MIFGIHTKAPKLADMYDLNVAAWLGSSDVHAVRYEDLVRHVRNLESERRRKTFLRRTVRCLPPFRQFPAIGASGSKVGADRKHSGTARENLTGIRIELPDYLPDRHRRLVDYAAPGLGSCSATSDIALEGERQSTSAYPPSPG